MDGDCRSNSFFFLSFLQGGATPLYAACQRGHIDVVERLLAANAKVDLPKNVSERN